MRSTTVSVIADCLSPSPKNAGPAAPVPSLLYISDLHQDSDHISTYSRIFMLHENHTKNIWKSRVSVRDSSGMGSMLRTSNEHKAPCDGEGTYPIVSMPYRFRKDVTLSSVVVALGSSLAPERERRLSSLCVMEILSSFIVTDVQPATVVQMSRLRRDGRGWEFALLRPRRYMYMGCHASRARDVLGGLLCSLAVLLVEQGSDDRAEDREEHAG